jgi:amidohydrolase
MKEIGFMPKSLVLFTALALASGTPAVAQSEFAAIDADMPSLMAIYRDLHANPELSLEEVRSAGIMAAEAKKAGFTVTTGVGGTGVVAVLKNGPGKTVLIRADMDALPLTEKTGLPYASKKPGVMHACGHDTHMTGWIGTARRLAATKDKWSGTVVMIGQPAEERVLGAKAMLKDGLYTRFPKPDYAIAFHDGPFPAGMVGVANGYALAAVDGVDIKVRGVGTHGAAPHLGRDPVLLGARIVNALQSIVSREINPLDSGVITVGVFQGGTKRNIIADEATLQLTVRSYKPEVRKVLLDGIARVAKGEAIAAGLPEDRMPEVKSDGESADSTFNTAVLTPRLTKLWTAHFEPGRVIAVPPAMASEDFGDFSRDYPGIESTIFWVGGTPRAAFEAAKGDLSKLPGLHSPQWAPAAEAVISTAVEAMTVAVHDLLRKS